MGTRGPAPKRSNERHGHRAKDDAPAQVPSLGDVTIPTADRTWHRTAKAWYASLRESGQSRFYESSDWQTAYVCAAAISKCLTSETLSAQLLGQVRGMMTDLLVTEGARRRAGLELVRATGVKTPAAKNVTQITDRRKRLVDAS